MDNFTNEEIKQLNACEGLLSFKSTWIYNKFIYSAENTILLIYGNQGGKTGGTAHQYVQRIMGTHPVPWKNVVYYECKVNAEERKEADERHEPLPERHQGGYYGAGYLPESLKCKECGDKLIRHKRESHIYRFCFETLPGQTPNIDVEGGESEIKNTQYPEFKKWLPKFLIKKDITVRSPSMVIANPFGGKNIVVEFVSYNQSTAATAGVQRLSIWCDESPPMSFYEEQVPRLLAENGDMIFTYTPVDRGSWLFDEFYDKACVYYRTKAICDFLGKDGDKVERVEKTENPYDIAVLMAATDDNPTLSFAAVEAQFENFDDPDAVAIRRYGIFKQLSGRIFKKFAYDTHFINAEEYFPEGIVPHDYVHARGIDYHPQTPWACGCISLSPTNEAFIWCDYNPSPEKYTASEIAKNFALMGRDYKFRLNLIDPLSVATKKDNITVLDDLNTLFRDLKKEDIGTGGFWLTWETQGERGREIVRERLKNSVKVKRPFNNKAIENGRDTYLPTIWVLNNCKLSAKHMRNWRWSQWASSKELVTKEEKNKPEQKWSHFNMVWECIFKHPAFRPRRVQGSPHRRPAPTYYNNRNKRRG